MGQASVEQTHRQFRLPDSSIESVTSGKKLLLIAGDAHTVHERMADKIDSGPAPGVKFLFKGQDHADPISEPADLFHPAAALGLDLGTDIVEDGNTIFFRLCCQQEIKIRTIDQDEQGRAECPYVKDKGLAGPVDIAEMADNFRDPDHSTSFAASKSISSPASACAWPRPAGSMHITRGLAGDDHDVLRCGLQVAHRCHESVLSITAALAKE